MRKGAALRAGNFGSDSSLSFIDGPYVTVTSLGLLALV